MTMYYEGYRIRIYPTKEQETLLWKHIGCCRYIWNYMLEFQQYMHELGCGYISAYDLSRVLTCHKQDEGYEWLYEVSNHSLKRVISDLDESYIRFFKGISGFPKFKSRKRSKPSYPVCCEKFYFKEQNICQIQKIGKVKCKTDKRIPIGRKACKFSNVRVSYNNGKWFVSFGIERENQTYELTDKSMGIDLGTKELAIVACGEEKKIFHNINKTNKKIGLWENKIKHYDKCIARKKNYNKKYNIKCDGMNIQKLYNKRKRAYARLTGLRDNYIHQITHELVSMLPKRVVMEDLNVQGMMKNKHLSKAIQACKWYEFRFQMEYKCARRGIEFVLADRFYPSSKTCSCCGNIKKDLKLSDRTYICPVCGLEIDRDYNAAINLMNYCKPDEEDLQA